ncbi:MAG: hypothetical protein QNJ55_16225 [Xenococcus sp. MO_188.B8]|nr:hypothetical protein [Xenococcus sp. MO_188.B8]
MGRPAVIENLPVPPGDAHFVGVADNTKARQLLDWEPRIPLREGLKHTLNDYLATHQLCNA